MRKARLQAFTLVELLVVIGIIVLLMALIIPTLMKTYRQGGKLRIAADFQTISVALEAYRQDFGDIPRPDPSQPNTGAAILGKALLGPYGDGVLPPPAGTTDPADPPTFQMIAYHVGDCVRDSGGQQYVTIREIASGGQALTQYAYWAHFDATDNVDGPGFKTNLAAAKVWGPYVQAGKLKNQGVNLLDANGNPILYFPGRLGPVNLGLQNTLGGSQPYVDSSKTITVQPVNSLYNADDNLELFRRDAELPSSAITDKVVLNRIRIMLGDYNCNGYIDNGETAVNSPFILWSSSTDAVFGPADYTPDPANSTANQKVVTKCDDVTNFR